MGPQRIHWITMQNLFQNWDSLTGAHDQGLPQGREAIAQLGEALGGEGPVPPRVVRLAPKLRLDDE